MSPRKKKGGNKNKNENGNLLLRPIYVQSRATTAVIASAHLGRPFGIDISNVLR